MNINYDYNSKSSDITMKPIEIRLVGRFRFTSKIEEDHEHLLYKGVHTQTNELLFLKG
jgi:hypothetical protein